MSFYRERISLAVRGAIAEARLAAELHHPGLIGTAREILVERLLRPVLPAFLEFGTGKITDSEGRQSRQTDIVVYSPDIMPASLYDNHTGIFPIEACFYSIEVKSTISSTELRKVVDNATQLYTLQPLPRERNATPWVISMSCQIIR